MKITTISSKNQITIPKEMLLLLGLKHKDKLLIDRKGEELVLKPIKSSLVKQTAGSLDQFVSYPKLKKSFKEIMRITKKKTAKKLLSNL